MKYEAFEATARARWDEIPAAYTEGVDGLVIEREARASPDQAGVYILGECLTETYPSDYDGPSNVRSEIVLYYGSFRRLAAEDDTFDWETEIWETLTHELRHHLESLADEDDLDDIDTGLQHHFRRAEGQPFDPGYYRLGEERADGWFVLERAWFLEVRPQANGAVLFEWRGNPYVVRPPVLDADYLFMDVVGGVADAPDELTLVLVRRRSFAATLRGLLGRETASVANADVTAESPA